MKPPYVTEDQTERPTSPARRGGRAVSRRLPPYDFERGHPWPVDPVLIAALLVFGALVVAFVAGRRLTARLALDEAPTSWSPNASFTGAVTLGRCFVNIPGTARMEVGSRFAVIRPSGLRWFHPVWVDRSCVTAVYAGPRTSGTEGGIRFRGPAEGIERIGFWPEGGRRRSNGKEEEEVLSMLRHLGWPVSHQ